MTEIFLQQYRHGCVDIHNTYKPLDFWTCRKKIPGTFWTSQQNLNIKIQLGKLLWLMCNFIILLWIAYAWLFNRVWYHFSQYITFLHAWYHLREVEYLTTVFPVIVAAVPIILLVKFSPKIGYMYHISRNSNRRSTEVTIIIFLV